MPLAVVGENFNQMERSKRWIHDHLGHVEGMNKALAPRSAQSRFFTNARGTIKAWHRTHLIYVGLEGLGHTLGGSS